MNRKKTTIFQKYKKSALITLLVLISLGIGYYAMSLFLPQGLDRTLHTDGANNEPSLKNIGEKWWEARQLIYHDIPARILFSAPSSTNDAPNKINQAVWHEFDRVGQIFNPFNPRSEISRLNATEQSQPMTVTEDVYSAMRISQHLWHDSNGQFDPTMWQIKRLWQTAEKNQHIPDGKDIAGALHWTGFKKIQFPDTFKNTILINGHPVKFDFGGMVKGYAVDQVQQILLNYGVAAGLLQLGGEICAFGNNNDTPWRIGIQHPKQMKKVWGVISSKNSIRVSTSGNYRQPIRINGQSFYHIFSPETGQPVSEKILGVTTASIDGKETNARLDGIATAITVLGALKGIALAETLKIEAVILYEKQDGSIGEYSTAGLSGYYKRNKNQTLQTIE